MPWIGRERRRETVLGEGFLSEYFLVFEIKAFEWRVKVVLFEINSRIGEKKILWRGLFAIQTNNKKD